MYILFINITAHSDCHVSCSTRSNTRKTGFLALDTCANQCFLLSILHNYQCTICSDLLKIFDPHVSDTRENSDSQHLTRGNSDSKFSQIIKYDKSRANVKSKINVPFHVITSDFVAVCVLVCHAIAWHSDTTKVQGQVRKPIPNFLVKSRDAGVVLR